MKKSDICRYCGSVIRLVPAESIYGMKAAKRLGLIGEYIYQCQNCSARVGCHKGTTRPLGNVANEALRLNRIETHHIFDAYWKSQHMTRTGAYKWLSQHMRLPAKQTHIGGFEMDQCQQVIDFCGGDETSEEAA